MDEGLKSPYWPNVAGAVLSGAVLGATVEVLDPQGVRIELRRGPIAVRYKSSKVVRRSSF